MPGRPRCVAAGIVVVDPGHRGEGSLFQIEVGFVHDPLCRNCRTVVRRQPAPCSQAKPGAYCPVPTIRQLRIMGKTGFRESKTPPQPSEKSTNMPHPFSRDIRPNWEGFLRCLRREGTPDRVHFIELFLDNEVKTEIAHRWDLMAGVEPADPYYLLSERSEWQRFLGYDYVRCGLNGFEVAISKQRTAGDTAAMARQVGRGFVEEHRGPITTWEEFEAYPWPDPAAATTRNLEWFQENLPDDMCIVGSGGFAHCRIPDLGSWAMRRSATRCSTIASLWRPSAGDLLELYEFCVAPSSSSTASRCSGAPTTWAFATVPLLRPADLREYVLPGHRTMAAAAHAAGRPYLLHSCGRLDTIMDDLLNDVRIDGLHSFEDTIHTVEETKHRYGDRIAVLGGIDMDFLCRQDPAAIRPAPAGPWTPARAAAVTVWAAATALPTTCRWRTTSPCSTRGGGATPHAPREAAAGAAPRRAQESEAKGDCRGRCFPAT